MQRSPAPLAGGRYFFAAKSNLGSPVASVAWHYSYTMAPFGGYRMCERIKLWYGSCTVGTHRGDRRILGSGVCPAAGCCRPFSRRVGVPVYPRPGPHGGGGRGRFEAGGVPAGRRRPCGGAGGHRRQRGTRDGARTRSKHRRRGRGRCLLRVLAPVACSPLAAMSARSTAWAPAACRNSTSFDTSSTAATVLTRSRVDRDADSAGKRSAASCSRTSAWTRDASISPVRSNGARAIPQFYSYTNSIAIERAHCVGVVPKGAVPVRKLRVASECSYMDL